MPTEALLTWQGANLSFWLITIMVLVSGAVAAFSRNVVRAAFSLFFTLFGMAGYYVLLGSGFLAVTQVIIYVGGILVLLMFGILMTNQPLEAIQTGAGRLYILGSLTGLVLMGGVLLRIVLVAPWQQAERIVEPSETVRPLGELLLTRYLLPFELAALTLLLCLFGAAYLVRRLER